MKLSIVVPAYNEEKYIGACLQSILDEVKGKSDVEVIVINNASTDNTQAVAEKLGVRVVTESSKGLTKARQKGLEVSTGEYLANIDADVRLPKGWYDKISYYYQKYPNTVCISGPYRYYDATFIQNAFLGLVWKVGAPIIFRIVGYMVLGGNFVAKRQALLNIGGFDKNIAFYGEDTDIARRLSTQGKVAFFTNFFVYSSARRFAKQGLVRTNITYSLNFLWPVLFKKPFTNHHTD